MNRRFNARSVQKLISALVLLFLLFTAYGKVPEVRAGQASFLLSDGQFVYGPNVGDFQVDGFLQGSAPHLVSYAPQILGRAKYYSINPRVLLTLMEMSTGLLSQGANAEVENPFGLDEPGFLPQLERISNVMTEAYYQRFYGLDPASSQTEVLPPLTLRDGTLFEVDPETNAGTYAVLTAFALSYDADGFAAAMDVDNPHGFLSTYQTLFPTDDPLAKNNPVDSPREPAIMSVLPPVDLLQFPYARGYSWSFNGVHNSDGSNAPTDMSSIDFSPTWPNWNADTSAMWVVAAADGTPNRWSDCGFSILHADGWETLYYHLEAIPTTFGSTIHQNDPIGVIANTPAEALCSGGSSTGPHVHFSLRHNGLLVPIDGLLLSNWSIHSGRFSYDSNHSFMWLERNGTIRYAYTSKLLNDTHFFSGVAAPVGPAINSLIDGDYKPTLDWTDVTGATTYAVQVSPDPLFSVLAINKSNIASSSHTLETPLSSNRTYYWRVQAFNAAGDGGFWSSVWNLRTAHMPPTLLAPLAAQHLLTLRPTFDWNDVLETGVTGYTIQISADNTFTTLAHAGNTSISNYTPGVDLPRGQLYWRVRTLGANGPSGWSEVRSYQGPNPPPAPLLSLPLNSRQILNLSSGAPAFSWMNVLVPIGTTLKQYQFQLDTTTSFVSPAVDVNVPVTAYVPGISVMPNTTYYWRVRAVNTLDEPGPWSDIWSLSIPPLTPVLLAPTDGAHATSLRPALDWSDVSGVGYYTLEISKNNGFTQIIVKDSSSTSAHTLSVDLPPAQTLYWRVRSEGSGGPGKWSQVRSFSTPNPPGVPILFSPNPNATTTDYRPMFRWNQVVVPRGTQFDHYQVQVSADKSFSTLAVNANVTGSLTKMYTPGADLAANTQYFWRIRAFNAGNEESSWSEVRAFFTPPPVIDTPRPRNYSLDPALSAPTTIAPRNDNASNTLRPVLDWTDMPGAASYIVQVSLDPTFAPSTLIASVTTVDSQYAFVEDVPAGTVLYWRLLTVNGNRISQWSPVSVFQVP